MEQISIDDFKKIEIKIGTILSAQKIEGADKLLLLEVDLGEEIPRQIVSGIAEYFSDTSELVGKQSPFVTNLAPRELRGHMSNGMILATSGDFGLALLHPSVKVPPGAKIK
jgi:methionine--tRNA ligase beta chain